MAPTLPFLVLFLLGLVTAQTPGKTPEVHPKLDTWKCTKRGGCVKQKTAFVLDDLSHNVHQLKNPSLNCGTWGNVPNVTVCPDEKTCAENCIVEGITDYSKAGVVTHGGSITLHQLENGTTVSPRGYLLAENGVEYEMLKLTGHEISFDIDSSKLPCGMNAALYMAEMSKTGGRNELNPGGAAYGTGYCDAQCFKFPFVNGVGNIEGKGSCCNEMDIWEANKMATALTPHVCNHTGLYECTGDECKFNGVCDEWGCGFNPYAQGNKDYYGPGLTVNTRRPFTVVTQFPAKNGTLQEIRRLYVQDGKVIQNAYVNVTGTPSKVNYIDDAYCTAQGTGAARFMELGAVEGMGAALSRGMTLIFTIWWDTSGFMNWLDSGNSGPCNATEGNPAVVTTIQPDPAVTFSNIKWGEIGSTYTSYGGYGY